MRVGLRATISGDAHQEVAHVRYLHDPVDFHQPDADNDVYHEVEDSVGDGDTLGNAVFGFEDVFEVPARLVDELWPLQEQDDEPKICWSHSCLV